MTKFRFNKEPFYFKCPVCGLETRFRSTAIMHRQCGKGEPIKAVEDNYTFKAHLKEFYPDEYARRFGKE